VFVTKFNFMKKLLLGIVIILSMSNLKAQTIIYDLTAADLSTPDGPGWCGWGEYNGAPLTFTWTSIGSGPVTSVTAEFSVAFYIGGPLGIDFNASSDGSVSVFDTCYTAPLISFPLSNGLYNVGGANTVQINYNITVFETTPTGLNLAETLSGPFHVRLSVNYGCSPSSGVDVQSLCHPLTWIDGNTYSSSNNTAVTTIPNAGGCDSTVSLDYTYIPITSTDIQSSCQPLAWIDGNTYSSSNNSAMQTVITGAGCDSIVTLDYTLIPTVTSADYAIVSLGNQLVVSPINGIQTYQWLDCDNNFAVIPSETGQSFFPSTTGNYALEVSINGQCSDTSACYLVTGTNSIDDLTFKSSIKIYPNPTADDVHIDLEQKYESIQLNVYNSIGRKLNSLIYTNTDKINLTLDIVAGLYIFEIITGSNERGTFLIEKQ
jgi:hypothetical protein